MDKNETYRTIEWLTIPQAADLLGVSRQALSSMKTKHGDLLFPLAKRLSNRWMIHQKDVRLYEKRKKRIPHKKSGRKAKETHSEQE